MTSYKRHTPTADRDGFRLAVGRGILWEGSRFREDGFHPFVCLVDIG